MRRRAKEARERKRQQALLKRKAELKAKREAHEKLVKEYREKQEKLKREIKEAQAKFREEWKRTNTPAEIPDNPYDEEENE